MNRDCVRLYTYILSVKVCLNAEHDGFSYDG